MKRLSKKSSLQGLLFCLVILAGCAAESPVQEDTTPASLTPQPLATTEAPASPTPSPEIQDWWQPQVGLRWQWQLDGELDLSVQAAIYVIDLNEASAGIVEGLHQQGHRAICYISVGSWEDWRPDADDFPVDVLGNDYDGWPGERWLDIRQMDTLAPIMTARLDECAEKGFDGVEPDNMDAYSNETGFPLSYADQLAYNLWLAEEAHNRGLAIAVKNNSEQVPDLLPHFDLAIVESCFLWDECEAYSAFIESGKPVLAAVYTDTEVDFEAVCARAEELRFSVILKNRDLKEDVTYCD